MLHDYIISLTENGSTTFEDTAIPLITLAKSIFKELTRLNSLELGSGHFPLLKKLYSADSRDAIPV